MLHGIAWHVSYPRRPEHTFITLDTAYAARAMKDAAYINWPVRVQPISFHGDNALNCMTTVADLVDYLHANDPLTLDMTTRKDGILSL